MTKLGVWKLNDDGTPGPYIGEAVDDGTWVRPNDPDDYIVHYEDEERPPDAVTLYRIEEIPLFARQCDECGGLGEVERQVTRIRGRNEKVLGVVKIPCPKCGGK